MKSRPERRTSRDRLIAKRLSYVGRECVFCEKGMTKLGRYRASREHLLPRINGGHFGKDGLMPIYVCQACNSDKGQMWIEDWFELLKEKNDWRWRPVAKFIAENPLLILRGRQILAARKDLPK